MYGAVAARSRSWGVLMNGLVVGGAASQPTAGFGPAHAGSGGGGLAPLSSLVRGPPVPYGLVKDTWGTPVLWMRLSVNCGPPWHSMQPPLPWKSFSPRSAAGATAPTPK